jgi:hypothetical protein
MQPITARIPITGTTAMIIMITLTQHVFAVFTILTDMIITAIITPILTGTILIHGILDIVFIWDTTGGIRFMGIAQCMDIRTTDTVMDTVTDTAMVVAVMGITTGDITTVSIITHRIMAIADQSDHQVAPAGRILKHLVKTMKHVLAEALQQFTKAAKAEL